ncbi:penicillin-binding transpeptidase domain-containing protein [Anaeroselena agilis]|uniref:beta-lactamase n=1 Tax=Anaeroselena agilis TaxID=3063788 RepID=A0ABU3P1W0_9FIRM|nr:penicillin-binding transpeptidase domain-containing protein [Selenomonadales bacterium 4137-cl]
MKKILWFLCALLLAYATAAAEASPAVEVRDDLGKYFRGYTGTMVIYDQAGDRYVVYNEPQSRKRLSPCSTFKIYNSLIGLETGVLAAEDEQTLVKWDGTRHSIESWNHDQTLASATRNSVVWYYQKLAARIGEQRMQEHLDAIGYGNRDISGGLTTFWLRSSLRISAMEQVEMLRRLYSGELPFAPRNVAVVRKNITLSADGKTPFMGKTGSGFENGRWLLGWFVGCVERDGNRYIFAVNIEAPDGASGGAARRIAEAVLKDFAILP